MSCDHAPSAVLRSAAVLAGPGVARGRRTDRPGGGPGGPRCRRRTLLLAALAAGLVSLLAATGYGQGYYQNRRGEVVTRVDFGEAQFTDCLLSRARLTRIRLDGLALRDCTGDATELTAVSLIRPSFTNVTMTDVRWDGGKLAGRLTGLELPSLRLERCSGGEWLLEGTEVSELRLTRLHARSLRIEGMEVGGGELGNIKARSTRWRRCDLSDARLDSVQLSDAELTGCDLSDIRASRCDLRDARFDNCEIRGLVINGHNIEELIRKAER